MQQQPWPQQPPPDPMGAGNFGPPPSAPGNGKAVASLVLGIIALCVAWIALLGTAVSVIAGTVGIVLGVMARKEAARDRRPTGMATAGIVLSILGIVVALVWLVVAFQLIDHCESNPDTPFCRGFNQGLGRDMDAQQPTALGNPLAMAWALLAAPRVGRGRHHGPAWST